MPGQMIVMRCPVGYRQTDYAASYGTRMAAVSDGYLNERELVEQVERHSVLPDTLPGLLDMSADQDHPVFRVYPLSKGVAACRTYRVRNRLDDERACLFSSSLVFSPEEAEAYLRDPDCLTDKTYYDTYASCCERILGNSGKRLLVDRSLAERLPRPAGKDAGRPARADLFRECGMDEGSLALYLQGLLLCADDPKRSMAVILPEAVRANWRSGDLTEQLICESYVILPSRYRKRIGFVSRWAGSLSGEQLSGIQVCFYHPGKDRSDVRELQKSGCILLDLEDHTSANVSISTPKLIRLMTESMHSEEGFRQYREFGSRVSALFQAGDRLTSRRLENLLTLFTLQDDPNADGDKRDEAMATVITAFGPKAIQNRSGLREMLHGEIDRFLTRNAAPSERILSALQTWMTAGDSGESQLEQLFRLQLDAVYTRTVPPELLTELERFIRQDDRYGKLLGEYCREKQTELLDPESTACCSDSFMALIKAVSATDGGYPGALYAAAQGFLDAGIRAAQEKKLWKLVPAWLSFNAEYLGRSRRDDAERLTEIYGYLLWILHSAADKESKAQAVSLLKAEPARAEAQKQQRLFSGVLIPHLEYLAAQQTPPLDVELDLLLEAACSGDDEISHKLLNVYLQFLKNGADKKHYDFTPSIRQISKAEDMDKRVKLFMIAPTLESLRMELDAAYIPEQESILPLFRCVSPEKLRDSRNTRPVFKYILKQASRKPDFFWDETIREVDRAGAILPLFLFLVEQNDPARTVVERSIVNRGVTTRKTVLSYAGEKTPELRNELLSIEKKWFWEELYHSKDTADWMHILKAELSLAEGADEETGAKIQEGVNKAFSSRLEQFPDLAEADPAQIAELSGICRQLNIREQQDKLELILKVDRFWDEQNTKKLEELFFAEPSEGTDSIARRRMAYLLKTDGEKKSRSAVAAALMLSDPGNGKVDREACLRKFFRCFREDDARIKVAFQVLCEPQHFSRRYRDDATEIMLCCLTDMLGTRLEVFCNSGTRRLKLELGTYMERLRSQYETEREYGKLVSAMKKADISIAAGERPRTSGSRFGGLILVLALVVSLIAAAAVIVGLRFLLHEREMMNAVILFALVFIALVVQVTRLICLRRDV